MTDTFSLRLSDFDYYLPDELIAQRPAEQRADSRLLCLNRRSGRTDHRSFRQFADILREGDLLVFNDTKVFPARVMARRETGGAVEVLFLQYPRGSSEVPCLVRPGRRVKGESRLFLDDGCLLIVSRKEDGFTVRAEGTDLAGILEKYGQVPLPPYIRRPTGADKKDGDRYQTVYARTSGAVAAPTAGLHFDESTMDHLGKRGIETCCITLHVGHGTFMPVRTADVTDHIMETERYNVPFEAAEQLKRVRQDGSRVVAVGTTVVRTLESAFDGEKVKAGPGASSLFIYPGFRFSVVDALLTNFHLPRSTLLMLVCAFAGTDATMKAYDEAVGERYRFYSYGDAMFIE